MEQIIQGLDEYALVFSLVALGSAVLLVVSLVATPWFVASLPRDYFHQNSAQASRKGLTAALIRLLKNLTGLTLVVLGFILMLTPGPGLIVLLIGISLTEIPGKKHLLVRIAIQPHVFKSLNWMRAHRGKPPFEYPGTTL